MEENLNPPNANLFERLCDTNILYQGFVAVKRNKGSHGIDGVSIEKFSQQLDKELAQLSEELKSWSYKPSPVRRVEIPKPGKNAGVRILGVPTIRDRVVQTTLKQLLEPIFDPTFSDNSYGFRPSRNQEQAVQAALKIVKSGKSYVVDMDLEKFFDKVSHDRLIHRLSLTISDKRILRLVGMTLRSGAMDNGLFCKTEEGTTQGSPLSPLLSNIVLDELDKELEHRGLEFCRFADDSNIFVASQKAGERVMRNITKFIETKLKLKVNRSKSQVAKSDKVKFLGMTIVNDAIAISKASMQRAFDKVRSLTPRGTHKTLEDTIQSIMRWYTGWYNYHKMTYFPSQFSAIEARLRRRLRARIVVQCKKRRYLSKRLVKRGVKPGLVYSNIFSNKGKWALSICPAMHKGYSNEWFESQGLRRLSESKLEHWFGIRKWVKL